VKEYGGLLVIILDEHGPSVTPPRKPVKMASHRLEVKLRIICIIKKQPNIVKRKRIQKIRVAVIASPKRKK